MIDFLAFFTVYFILGEFTIFAVCQFGKQSNEEFRVFSLGLIFRILLTYGYYAYGTHTPADISWYYDYSEKGIIIWKDLFTPGTTFVLNLAALLHPLVALFSNRLLMLFVPFSFLGFFGSMFFYRVLKPLFANRKKKTELYFLAFFLPNMVFWTSNLGKDSIIYFGLMLTLYGVVNGPEKIKNIILIAVGGAVVYLVRPHVLLFLLVGVGIGAVIDRRGFSIRTAALVVIAGVGFLLLHQKIFEFVGIQSEDESTQGVYQTGVNRMEEDSRGLSNVGGGANLEQEDSMSSFRRSTWWSSCAAPLCGRRESPFNSGQHLKIFCTSISCSISFSIGRSSDR